ncbi:MAG: peptidylprolyl isomerase [Bryobacteraceae bacterium]
MSAQTPAPKPATETATPAAKVEREPGLYGTIATSLGNIEVKLFEKESPITVKNFTDLALGRKLWTDPKTNQRVRRPLYNGLIFHRVIPGFMIQGGDPLGIGMGGTDVIPDEFHPSLTFDQPGRLAMANSGLQTGSSQFFITEAPTTYLNGRHTIFGQVTEGMDVVEKITNTPRGADDKPKTPVRIVRVSFARVGPGPAISAAPAKPKPARAKTAPGASKPKPAAAKRKPVAAKPIVEAPKP